MNPEYTRVTRSKTRNQNMNVENETTKVSAKDSTVKLERSLVALSIVNDGSEAKTVRSERILKKPTLGAHGIGNKENIFNHGPGTPATPIANFKTRECFMSPDVNRSPLKRASLTPNPKNFLRKAEDPIAQRIDSPKVVKDLKVKDVPKTAVYFQQLVEKEEWKFKESCSRWNKVMEENSAPEGVHGSILSAIGQALLFQNKRFKQFKELIELHKDKTAEKAAYASDLDGFWEMIFFQVEDVHRRFAELESLRANNWEEKKAEPVSKPKRIKKSVVLKNNVEPSKVQKPAVSSKFKMFRQQMMEKKQAEEQSKMASMHVC